MTKLLPLIPAFGVCFAGGWLLPPAPVDRTQSLRIQSQVELVGKAGYAVWKADAEKAETARGQQLQAANEVKELAAKADQIRAIIGEITAWTRQNDPLIKNREESRKWTERVSEDSSYKKVCETKKKLEAVIGEKEKLGGMAWNDRKEWSKRYDEALKAHDEALRQSLAALEALRAQQPGGAAQ